jgi:hypothetical protein
MVAKANKHRPTFAGELAKRLKEREDLVREAREKRRNKKHPSLAPQEVKTADKVIEPVKMTDWKFSKIKEKVEQGNYLFNPDKDPTYFREDDIDYMINMLRFNVKDFATLPLLQPLYMKATLTLKLLLSNENLCLTSIYDKL